MFQNSQACGSRERRLSGSVRLVFTANLFRQRVLTLEIHLSRRNQHWVSPGPIQIITMEADEQISRSPSPVPAPPVATAPGPRASALQKLYNDAIAHVLKTCSYHNFSACFPTPAAQVPGSLKLLHEQFTEELAKSMRREFDGILEDRHVVGSLNELDGLIEDARRRKDRGGAESVA